MVHPTILWAQRSDTVLVTICVPDATNVLLRITDALDFSCKSGDQEYTCHFPLYGKVIPEESSYNVRPRDIFVQLKKGDPDGPFWPKLTPNKLSYIQIDWNRWKDEDELNGAEEDLLGMPGGFDMSSLMNQYGGGIGGGAGLEGLGLGAEGEKDAEEDSPEEEMPPLEAN